MKYLLDTHTALWSLGEYDTLSKTATEIIANESGSLYVSIVSAWEVAIKTGVGKLDFEGGSKRFIEEMRISRVKILGVESSHIHYVETLPLIHRDPFDRLLIAAAKVEDMTILTADKDIHMYDVLSLW